MIAFVHCLGHTPDFHILSHIECSMSTVVVSVFSNSARMLSVPAAFPFLRRLIAWVTSLRVIFGVLSVWKVGAHCFRVLGSYSCIKCLGDILDDKSSWPQHITNLEDTLTRSLGILYMTRPYLTSALKSVYIVFTAVYSHLQYAIGAWGSMPKIALNHLNVQHNKLCEP